MSVKFRIPPKGTTCLEGVKYDVIMDITIKQDVTY
jgi:hypothetical protein